MSGNAEIARLALSNLNPAERAALLRDFMQSPGPDKLLKTSEAAAALGCHRQTVFRYRKRGLLTCVKRSLRCVRWRKSEIMALANGGAQ